MWPEHVGGRITCGACEDGGTGAGVGMGTGMASGKSIMESCDSIHMHMYVHIMSKMVYLCETSK